jgi:acetyltransferase-like isoleucine patch superfamily enzyme
VSIAKSVVSRLAQVLEGVLLGDGVQVDAYAMIGVSATAARGAETLVGPGCWFRSHTVVYAGNRIGARLQTGHGAMIRELNDIGDDVSIGTQSIVEHHVVLRDKVRIHSQAFIPEFTVIETGAWIGPRVCFTNARWPASRKAKDYLQGVHIEPFVRIGANSTILPGVRIGRGAIIGAGAVVTKDVPPGVVMAGNPARQIKTVAELRYPDDPETLPYPDG